MPIAAPSLAAAALILFVEILKELPATLILRPFNFDTLAVRAYSYASDKRQFQKYVTDTSMLPKLELTQALPKGA